jgi:hypothetical protein
MAASHPCPCGLPTARLPASDSTPCACPLAPSGPRRQLRKWHDILRDKVVTLMGTDLVRYKDRWAAGVKDMRDIFVRLESEGYTRESQQVWRQHWDFQLYKALEYQYIQVGCVSFAHWMAVDVGWSAADLFYLLLPRP